MRFSFRSQPTGGVRVIGEIPDYRLCRLEGRNGIGKSLAVRLLELITGQGPYVSMPSAWLSLRDNLGPTDVEVTGLQDGASLLVQLRPSEWPEEPLALLTGQLGSAYLNGQEISFEQVSSQLRVTRVAGDETISTQFRSGILADAAVVDHQLRLLGAAADDLVAVTARLSKDVGGLSVEALRGIETRQLAVTAEREKIARRLEDASRQMRRITEVVDLQSRLAMLTAERPSLEASLEEIERALTQLKTELEEGQLLCESLRPVAERKGELSLQLRKLIARRERQTHNAAGLRVRVRRLAAQLGLSEDADELRRALAQTRSERHAWQRDRLALTVIPDVVDLIRRVRAPLLGVSGSSIDAEIIGVLNDQQLTAEALRQALTTREQDLLSHQQVELAGEIEARVSTLELRENTISAAVQQLRDADRATERVRTTEQQIRELSAALEKGASNDYAAALEAVKLLEEKRLSLVEERARLRFELELLKGMDPVEDLSARLAELRAELALQGDGTRELSEARLYESKLRETLRSCEEELLAAHAERNSLLRRLAESVALIEVGSDYEWLRRAIPEQIPLQRLADAESLRRIERLADAVARVQTGLDLVVGQAVPALSATLHSLGDAVGRSQVLAPSRYHDAMVHYYETSFGAALADSAVRTAIFDGGRFDRLDLIRGDATWSTPSGEPRRRPIEALSSGERAFAYILASILQRPNETARNRLLVLDEFGAFIEAGRHEQLMRFLQDRVLDEGRAHQVVIILPLRQLVGAAATEPNRAELEQQISEHGYFSQAVSPS